MRKEIDSTMMIRDMGDNYSFEKTTLRLDWF